MAFLLDTQLLLSRCPLCYVDTPNLSFITKIDTGDFAGVKRFWSIYRCARCAGLVTARADTSGGAVTDFFPPGQIQVSDDIPERARQFLVEAINSQSAPSGAVMLAASAVDAMLKAKNLKTGALYDRITEALEQNLITAEMAEWAHDVRLDANDQRHADEEAPLPTSDRAQKCVDFAMALGEFLYVLPARVERGRASAKPS